MWKSVAIILNCLLIIFLLFHVNTTADNRRTNMVVSCSKRDQRTSTKQNQNDSRFQSVNSLSKGQQQQINLTLRHVGVLSSANIPSTVEYFQQQFST